MIPPIVKRKTTPLEKTVEAYFKRRCREIGALSYKFTSPHYVGVSDQIMLHKSHVYFVEIKRIGGKQSAVQKCFQKEIIDHGGIYILLAGHDEVAQFIESIE